MTAPHVRGGGETAPSHHLRRLYQRPLTDLGEAGGARLAGIFSPSYDAELVSKYLTDQFLAQASTYAEKYDDPGVWRHYLSAAFRRIGLEESGRRGLTILDIGSGAGNTIVPLLDLCPESLVIASDLSVPLLAMLREALLAKGLLARCPLLQLNAEELDFAPESFDLVVGGAVLHHLIHPDKAIEGCARILKRGGRALFFEPFENGHAILAMLYREILNDRRARRLPREARRFLEAMIRDYMVRKGKDKTQPIDAALDDKWLFTRQCFMELAERCGFSSCTIFPLHPTERQFRGKTEVNLRLAIGREKEVLPAWAWERIESCDRDFSDDFKNELLIEGGIILQR